MKTEIFIEKIYTNKLLRVSLHLIFWLFMFGLQWYINGISFSSNRAFPESTKVQQLVVGIVNFVIFYYPFVYYVLPNLFLKKKILFGIIVSIILVMIYAYLETITEGLIIKSCLSCMETLEISNPAFYNYLHRDVNQRLFGKVASLGILIGLVFTLAIPLATKLGIRTFRQQIKTARISKENIQLEFDFLKSQVNPHFLFNTLNNIYALILNDEKEKSAATVARLSQFLRYTLYESNDKEVPVEKELQLLNDYIAMESIRLNFTKVHSNFTDDGSVSSLPPLLMLPVIENAFKYADDDAGKNINIDLVIDQNNIHFKIENDVDIRRKAENGGIGLQNFRKRLELYYPGSFEYRVQSNDNFYKAIINIET